MSCLGRIDRYLGRYVDSVVAPENLRDAVRYSLLGGGKRLRPLLAWHAARAAGGRGESALPAAAAVELVHAFSLVHDDLPGLDNDDLRRGRPTLHVYAGEPMAILAGDLMLALAFDVIARGATDPAVAASLTRELSQATGAMISGQVFDTIGGLDASLAPLERLRLTHAGKTGALIRAACRMGALSAAGPGSSGTGPASVEALTHYGEAVGLMFQIVDDILDVEGTAEETGKRTGKDGRSGKLTYPGVLGVERSRAEVERLTVLAVEAVGPLGAKARPLVSLCHFVAKRVR